MRQLVSMKTESFIPTVLKTDVDGGVYLRDGITIAFFLPVPLDSVVDSIRFAFEKYLQTTPINKLKWCSVGADSEEYRPVSVKTFEQCRALLTKESAQKRKLTAYEIYDGEQDGDAPSEGFFVLGNPKDKHEPYETNLIQVYRPSVEVSTPNKADNFVEWVTDFASGLPYVYGYASPGLHWAEWNQIDALAEARAVAKRYPGFDVQYNELTRSDLDTKTRGSRWLTFLGPELIEKLGGIESIDSVSSEEIRVIPSGHGILLRAGILPEIGDRNRKLDTPLLRRIAVLLKPVTLFDEPSLRDSFFADEDDPDFFENWEWRFF